MQSLNKIIYLVRHCATTGQEPDAPLTETGSQQSVVLADWFSTQPIERIVSSPYARAYQSIVPLAQRLGLVIETDDRLVERVLCGTSLPDWQTQLAASFTDLDLCLPGGESSRTTMARGVEVLHDVLRHGATVTVVVTHGNLMTLMLKHFNNEVGFAEWQQLTNPDVYCIEFMDETAQVTRICYCIGI